MAEVTETANLVALRRAIREDNVSATDFADLMKIYGIKKRGETLNVEDSLHILTCLRNKLPSEEAVKFLKMHLDWLGEVGPENLIYVMEIGFLIGEDLVEISQISKAQEQYKQILEWTSKFGPCKSAEALAISKLAILAWHIDLKRDAQQYYTECFEILLEIMEKCERNSFPMAQVEMKFAMQAFVSCGKFLRFLGKYHMAEFFFQIALDYCHENAKDAEIANRYSIYVQLFRNELSQKKFLSVGVLDTIVPTQYECMAIEERKMFLQEKNLCDNSMMEFMRSYGLQCVCVTIRTLLQNPSTRYVLKRDYQTVSLLESQRLFDEEDQGDFEILVCHFNMALMLALCARVKFEMGQTDYRKFKEQAEKHSDACLPMFYLFKQLGSHVHLMMNVQLMMLEMCVREHSYEEAEKRAKIALEFSAHFDSRSWGVPDKDLATGRPLLDAKSFMKHVFDKVEADLLFMCVCMYYFWRGHVSEVKEYSELALKCLKNVDDKEKVHLLERLLESV